MKLSFLARMLLTVFAACAICVIAAVGISSEKLLSEGREALIQKSRAILSRVEVGAEYVAEMDTLGAVVSETKRQFPDGKISDEQRLKILKSVPVFAAFKLGANGAEKENYKFRVASDKPRNSVNSATQEELELINRFRNDLSLDEIVSESSDGNFILVTRPVRISQARGCLTCHGEPSTSPWGNEKDILGYQMENMKDGDLRGVFTIVSSLEPVKASARHATMSLILYALAITSITVFSGYLILRKPVQRITETALKLSSAATQVTVASAQMAKTSEVLSQGTSDQSSALVETAASMDQVNAMVAKNSEGASNAQAVAAQSQEQAKHGESVMNEMLMSLQRIDRSNGDMTQQIAQTNKQMSEFITIIGDIGNKTKIINDIVFQTRLLSFNASVEAARAGEAGKGFAVVAEEVGNLASMSGKAANEITSMLESSVKKVQDFVRESNQRSNELTRIGKQEVDSGLKVASDCKDVLGEIVGIANSMDHLVTDIARASAEQSKGVSEITLATARLGKVNESNVIAAQEAAQAADQLDDQAKVLQDSARELLATIHGTAQDSVVQRDKVFEFHAKRRDAA